jgi:hypothetical protein
MAGEFLDRNILVYAFTTDPRAIVAQALLERGVPSKCKVSMNSPMWRGASSA